MVVAILQVQTRDGFLLGLQHIPHGSSGIKPFKNKRAVYLQHGVLQVLQKTRKVF